MMGKARVIPLMAPALAFLALAACQARDGKDAPSPHEVPSVAPSMPATVTDPRTTEWLRSFAGRDTDHDGFISLAENAAAADNVFDAIDKDQDGEMSRAEFDAARAALGMTFTAGTADPIARADQDGDGQLTLAEWIAMVGADFKAADTDGDGRLSKAEWQAQTFLPQAPATSRPDATRSAPATPAPRKPG